MSSCVHRRYADAGTSLTSTQTFWKVLTVTVDGKLQALVYDILPFEEGAGNRCSECG